MENTIATPNLGLLAAIKDGLNFRSDGNDPRLSAFGNFPWNHQRIPLTVAPAQMKNLAPREPVSYA